MKKVCKWCGKPFEAASPAAKYCCPECHAAQRKQQKAEYHAREREKISEYLTERPCVVCGKVFVPRQRQYICCSKECSKQHHLDLKRKNNAGYKAKQKATKSQEKPAKPKPMPILEQMPARPKIKAHWINDYCAENPDMSYGKFVAAKGGHLPTVTIPEHLRRAANG